MEDGSKQQIRKTDLKDYEWVSPTETDNAKTSVAKTRESGTAFEPEHSNYHQFGPPAAVRATD